MRDPEYNRAMPRPCLATTKQFRRPIGDAERAILLSAGQGDITKGFYLLMEIYAHLHNQGFRPSNDALSGVIVTKPYAENA
jgi:hypothetical protein